MSQSPASSERRRSFLTRLNAGLASFAAMTGVAMAQVKSTPAATRFEPARHDKDDWLDSFGAKHRMVIDTIGYEGVTDALLFGNNFFRTNRTDYGIESGDLGVVIILRHRSTPFGYNDAMWAKYGATMAVRSKVQDPKTKQAPIVNLYNATDYGELIPTRGSTLESMAKLGTRFAVCSVATRAYAGAIAEATGGNADAIFTELTSNLVSNARMVPAGIVAVNRAQERGYSLVTV